MGTALEDVSRKILLGGGVVIFSRSLTVTPHSIKSIFERNSVAGK